MPDTLTDDATVFPAIAVPNATDARGYVSVRTPFQGLSNRTRQNKNRIDLIAPSTDGVRFERHVASDGALLAIAAPDAVDGETCIVDGVGKYQFVAASTATPLAPTVRTPTFVGGGAGRWILIAFGLGTVGAPNGIAQCDSAGRVPAASVRNAIVAFGDVMTPDFPTSSAVFVDVTACFVTLTGLKTGDVVKVGHSTTLFANTGKTVNSQTVIVQPTLGTVVLGQAGWANNTASVGSIPGGALASFVVVENGTHTVKLQGSSGDGSAVSLLVPSLHVIVIRP
jgi:hypothetical protein